MAAHVVSYGASLEVRLLRIKSRLLYGYRDKKSRYRDFEA